MKTGELKNWKLDGSEESLLFFAQRLNELVFDYTLDSYKYYALNISLLLTESLKRISKINDDLLKDENLKSIIEETNQRAQNDVITKAILGSQYQIFFPIKLSNDKEKVKLNLELLYNRLTLDKIIKAIFEQLPKEITSNSKDKINILTNNFVTALVNVGFHQSYIYYQANKFFFSGKRPEERTLELFFKYFDPKRTEYKVILKVSNSFQEIKDVCEKFDLIISNSPGSNNYKGKVKEFIDTKNSEQLFAIFKNIEVYDIQSARIEALEQLNGFAGLFTYFHHKNPPTIEKTVVVEHKTNSYIVEPSTSPMTKGDDMTHRNAGQFLDSFLKLFSVDRITQIRFNRVINLHSQALTTSSNENRILNLWICYETLFGGGKTTTVVHIINSLMHICSLKYFERIFDELSQSIRTWNLTQFDKIKILTKQTNDSKAVCVFVTASEYENERLELYKEMNNFPLLRYRIFDLNRNLKTADKILNYLIKHNERIKWQIKRLYRTRNLIVHDGYSPKNLEILIENAHSYFDQFMDSFIIDNMTLKSVITIDQAVANYEILNNNWIKMLKAKESNSLNKSNFEQMLLYKEYGH